MLAEGLVEHYAPVGPVEEQLVDSLTSQLWSLRRVYRVETGIYGWHMREIYEGDIKATRARSTPGLIIQIPEEDDTAPEPDELARLEELMEEVVETREQAALDVAAAFINDAHGANALTKLSRYETALRRGIERTLSQLRALAEERSNSST